MPRSTASSADQVDRLDEEMGEAELFRARPVRFVAIAGHGHERRPPQRGVVANVLGQRKAVHVPHAQVDEKHLGLELRGELE